MQRTMLVVSVLLVGCSIAGCSVEIIHDVEESTANEVLATLQRSGIDGEKLRSVQGSKATYTVAVPRGQAAEAWKILRRENLPRPAQEGLGEVFGKTGLVPTATQERALMHHALAGELSRTLQSVRGVLEARVHLVLPARDPLAPPDAPQSPSKASVLLRVSGKCPLEREAVQRLVAGSVKDLKTEAVSVVIVEQEAGRHAAGAGDAAASSVGPISSYVGHVSATAGAPAAASHTPPRTIAQRRWVITSPLQATRLRSRRTQRVPPTGTRGVTKSARSAQDSSVFSGYGGGSGPRVAFCGAYGLYCPIPVRPNGSHRSTSSPVYSNGRECSIHSRTGVSDCRRRREPLRPAPPATESERGLAWRGVVSPRADGVAWTGSASTASPRRLRCLWWAVSEVKGVRSP